MTDAAHVFRADTPQAAAAHAGEQVAQSRWLAIEQSRIDAFAAATNDHQWIHVDPSRAATESPFGGTIAHGFLTLSLIAGFFQECVQVGGLRMAVNYGLNRLRFVTPVRSGQRIRGVFRLVEVSPVSGGYQATWEITVEIEGEPRPACIAEMLLRWYV